MGRIELRLRRPDRAQSRLPDARLQVFRDAPARPNALARALETRAKVRPALRDLLPSRSPLRGAFARNAGEASAADPECVWFGRGVPLVAAPLRCDPGRHRARTGPRAARIPGPKPDLQPRRRDHRP